MTDLENLIAMCKVSVHLNVNNHRTEYKSVERWLEELTESQSSRISDEIKKNMVETDTIVELLFFPETPIGSHTIYHYSVNDAMTEALAILDDRK